MSLNSIFPNKNINEIKTQKYMKNLIREIIINYPEFYSIDAEDRWKNPYYSEMMALTSFLDLHYSSISFKQRIWHLENDNYEVQKCEMCKKLTKFSVTYYKKFCCDECKEIYLRDERNLESICENFAEDSDDKNIIEGIRNEYNKFCSKDERLFSKNLYYLRLVRMTLFLDEFYDHVPVKQRFWHFENNKFDIQTCKTCGTMLNWDACGENYKMFCDDECQESFEKLDGIGCQEINKKTRFLKKLEKSLNSNRMILKSVTKEIIEKKNETKALSQRNTNLKYTKNKQIKEFESKIRDSKIKLSKILDEIKDSEIKLSNVEIEIKRLTPQEENAIFITEEQKGIRLEIEKIYKRNRRQIKKYLNFVDSRKKFEKSMIPEMIRLLEEENRYYETLIHNLN